MQESTPALLRENASSSAVFDALHSTLEEFGPFLIEEKKSSLHIKNARAAFLGVHPRRTGLRLTVVLANAIESARVAKSERVTANRWHNEIDIKTADEVDLELVEWIRQAYNR